MALPPNRHSRSRRDKSRAHYKYTPLQTVPCPNCQQPKLSHRVCPNCGYYKGQEVIRAKV